jgi:hypothetical protein
MNIINRLADRFSKSNLCPPAASPANRGMKNHTASICAAAVVRVLIVNASTVLY